METSSADTARRPRAASAAARAPGDPDALALAAGELVGIAVVVLGLETDASSSSCTGQRLVACGPHPVGPHRGGDDRPDRVPGIQRGRGPGRSSGGPGAAASSACLLTPRQILALEHHRAVGGLVEAGDQLARRPARRSPTPRPVPASRRPGPRRRSRPRPARGPTVRRTSGDLRGRYTSRSRTERTGGAVGSSWVAVCVLGDQLLPKSGGGASGSTTVAGAGAANSMLPGSAASSLFRGSWGCCADISALLRTATAASARSGAISGSTSDS